MPLHHTPTLDDLMADSLIQTVMRADRVEPQALKSLLNSAALRIGAARPRRALTVFAGSAIDRRKPARTADASPGAVRAARMLPEDCGSACCV